MGEQAKHTAGPWVTHPLFPTYVVPADHAGRPIGGHVDDAEDLRIYAQPITTGPWRDRHRNEVEVSANARLIAAAPDFFSSAKGLIEAWDARTTAAQQIVTGRSDADLQKQAMAAIEGLRAAISKAESPQP